MKLVYGLEEVSFLVLTTILVKMLTSCCVYIVFMHLRIIKKTKEVIYHLKFAMYMHLSHIPKMCYTCDIC